MKRISIERLIHSKNNIDNLDKKVDAFLNEKIRPFLDSKKIIKKVWNYNTPDSHGVYIHLIFDLSPGIDFNRHYRNKLIKECEKYVKRL